MLIKWEDLKIGDEIIIPSNSNLKYLKIVKLGTKSHKTTFQKDVKEKLSFSYTYNNVVTSYDVNKPFTCQEDITKHDSVFYLKNEGNYRDIWLVKRENYD